jgi:cytochrome c-type biogenesis protein CcmH/NrfG
VRTSRLFVLIAFAAALTAACSRHSDASSQQFVSRGDQFSAEQKYEAAAIEYRNAIKARPGNLDAHLKLAQTQVALGKPAEAYLSYSNASALTSAPGDSRALIGAGQILLAAGKIEEAKGRAQQAVQQDSGNVEALVLLGSAQSGSDELEAAEASLRRATVLAPDNELANRALAAFYMANGRADDAEPYFRAAAARTDQHLRSTLALADYYIAQGRPDNARAALRNVVPPDLQNEVDRRLAALGDPSIPRPSSHTDR